MDWLAANLEVLENEDATEDEEDEEDDLQGPNEKRQKQQGTGPLRQASRLRRPLCGQGTHRPLLINKGLAMGQGLPKTLSNLRVLFYLDLHSGKSNLQVLFTWIFAASSQSWFGPFANNAQGAQNISQHLGSVGATNQVVAPIMDSSQGIAIQQLPYGPGACANMSVNNNVVTDILLVS